MQTISFNDALLIFIADCLAVANMNKGKKAAIKEMVSRANKLFREFQPTPERVAEVRSTIMLAAA